MSIFRCTTPAISGPHHLPVIKGATAPEDLGAARLSCRNTERLRHTRATDLLNTKAELVDCPVLLGHAPPQHHPELHALG
jgi:integrase